MNQLNSLWGSSTNDIFAVGQSGTALHYDGSAWSSVPSSTTKHLNGVWGSSASDVFAVGQSGTIMHYDGTAWSGPMTSNTNLELYGASASSASDVYACGATGTVVRYNGMAWSRVSGLPYDGLHGMYTAGPADVFAVGQGGTLLHYDGVTWAFYAGAPTSRTLNSVWGSSGGDVFAVGEAGTIVHYDGSDWSLMTSNTVKHLYGVWGSSSVDMFAVGAGGTVLHYSSSGSSSTTTTAGLTTTTTVIPEIVCPFSRAAKKNSRTVRQLRDASLTTAMGAYIAGMYYQDLPELGAILTYDAGLCDRFSRLTRKHMPAARKLIAQGRAVMSADDLLELYAFLLDMQRRSGPKLRMDIGFILHGMESGWLTEWLGVRIE